MALRILDATTRDACNAAASQVEQCEALIAPWEGGNVTARLFAADGTTLLRTLTLPAFVINTETPRGVVCGAHIADSHVATGTPGLWVFRAGSTDIFSIDAGTSGASVNHAGNVLELCTPTLAGVIFTARASLPPVELPSWLPAVGVCAEINSGTTIGSAVRAMGGNSYAGTDPDDIVDPWSGGALVYISGQPYLVVMGGGHGDSAFNGAVKFGPLYGSGSSSPTWSAFLAGSDPSDVQNASTYLDGRQSSCHSYNNLCGVGDTLYSLRTDAYYSSGFSSTTGYAFTPSGQTTLAAWPGSGQYGAMAHYDGKIYGVVGGSTFSRLRIYDIAGDSYTSEGNADIAFKNYVGMAIDSTRGRALAIGAADGSTKSAYWNLSDLSRTIDVDTPSGWVMSLEFDPDRDAFVSLQSNSLTLLEADAADLAAGSGATWVGRTFTGTTPPAVPTQGNFGRFRYVPELKGFIHAPGLESHVYFFRSA